MSKAVIVFSGYNQRAVIAFLRTLQKNRIRFGIIAKAEDDSILKTVYEKYVVYIRREVTLELRTFIGGINIAKQYLEADSYLLAPTTEALNRFMLRHRSSIEAIDCVIPLIDEKLYAKLSDKKSFSELVGAFGLMIPRELIVSEIKQFPIVVKPVAYITQKGEYSISPVIVQTEKQWKKFLEQHSVEEYFFQEYITGESYYLLYYFSKSGEIFKFSQENLMQQPEGKSILAAVPSDIHKLDISKKYENLLQMLSFHGLIMIELRKQKQEYYMIEANPRFWGPSQLFVDAGYNFFENMLSDYGFEILNEIEDKDIEMKETKYFWTGGVQDVINAGKNVVVYSEKIIDEDWAAFDIYNRPDTKRLFIEKL